MIRSLVFRRPAVSLVADPDPVTHPVRVPDSWTLWRMGEREYKRDAAGVIWSRVVGSKAAFVLAFFVERLASEAA